MIKITVVGFPGLEIPTAGFPGLEIPTAGFPGLEIPIADITHHHPNLFRVNNFEYGKGTSVFFLIWYVAVASNQTCGFWKPPTVITNHCKGQRASFFSSS